MTALAEVEKNLKNAVALVKRNSSAARSMQTNFGYMLSTLYRVTT
jgi:hypothetical protein